MPAPTIDGTAASTSTGGPGTITISTTLPNDIIVVLFGWEIPNSTSPAQSVTSISSTSSLVWHKRSAQTYVGTYTFRAEIWWALAPLALTGEVITPVLSSNAIDDACTLAFGVNGAASLTAPFDTNPGLTVYDVGTPPTNNPPYSTTDLDDLVFVFGVNATPGYYMTSSWTPLKEALNSGGIAYCTVSSFYTTVTNPQSSAPSSFGPGSATGADAIWLVDAIAGVLSGIPNFTTVGVSHFEPVGRRLPMVN